MMDREELRERSMSNRHKNSVRNRKALCSYIERGIYAAVNMGRTSERFEMTKLRLMAFGDTDLLNDVINYYRNSGLSVYIINETVVDISWD